MTFDAFRNKVANLPNYQNEGERRSGGVLGIYVMYAKWIGENEWIFVRAYETLKGLQHMVATIEKEIFEKQDYKVLYLRGNSENYVEELLIAESANDDAT